MNVLITGCGGMLGSAIYPYFLSSYTTVVASDKVVSEPWLQSLDVRDEDAFIKCFNSVNPDLVLHLAAETDLEFCENHPDIAKATNADATRHIAETCSKHGKTLVYISTAGVFDGNKKDLYIETDEAHPLMVYGHTKLAGEQHVKTLCEKYFIVRAGWMVGGGLKKDHKFVSLILNQLIAGEKTIHAVNDKWGTPTYTHDFAINLFRLINTKSYGLYHMVCEGVATRYDVAAQILKILGQNDIDLIPVSSDYFSDRYFAPRPNSEMMRNANLSNIGINLMRPWQVALQEYIFREYPHLIEKTLGNL